MSKRITPEMVRRAIPDATVHPVSSRRALIDKLLDRTNPCGAIIQIDQFDEDRRTFLQSAARHFPLLPMMVVANGGGCDQCPPAVGCIESGSEPAALERQIAETMTQYRSGERRRSNRFEWPIRARFVDGDGTIHQVSEISAGGAFLEPHGPIGDRDTVRTIELYFQNFSITTTCTILDSRFVSSRKANGFRIAFESLSASAGEFIDRVVNDAIVKLLLDPTTKPAIPTIEEDDLVLEASTEFALSD